MKGGKKLNYLSEIPAFNNWTRYNSAINKSDICLWHSLMFMANRFGWKEFTVQILTLLSESKLTKNEFYKSRNKLKQFNLIDFGGNKSTIYKINSIVSLYGTQNGTQSVTQNSTQMITQSMTQSVKINKTRNKKLETRNKKEIIKEKNVKEKFGEFENILLTSEEFSKLQSRLGSECNGYIECLSNYIASTGKRYKSHYATILSWIQKDNQNNKTGGENYGNGYGDSGKCQNRKLCTEYPE